MNIAELFAKRTNEALTRSVEIAVNKKQKTVDTEHILWGITFDDVVVGKILKDVNLDPLDIRKETEKQMSEGRYANDNPEFTPRASQVIQLAYQESLQLGHSYIGTEHLLLALILEYEGLGAQILKKFGITHQQLRSSVIKLVGEGDKEGEKVGFTGDTPTLDQFTKDLTNLAKQDKIDPVIGRDQEITRVIEILSRRKKNNPVLIGEPGVGKTAIAEGLAHRIVSGNIPEILQGKKVKALDLTGMVAGSKFRGEFEERAKNLLKELEQSGQNIILFIDEIHTIIGSGAQQGELDFSNILKPALARGEIQIIGATTLDEYQKYIEKDAALERRFQPVIVSEPSIEDTIKILKGLRPRYESHHKLNISDEAIELAAKLSYRYIHNRFLPDKAIDLLDEACSKVRLKFASEPLDLRNYKVQIKKLEAERESLTRAGLHKEAAELKVQIEQLKEKIKPIEEEWLRIRGTGTPEVKKKDILEVISNMTGIPVSDLSDIDKTNLLNIEQELKKRVAGQDEAVKLVADAVVRNRLGLTAPNRPIAVFLFLGPTGVGKTHLAKSLAEVVYGNKDDLIRIDMSEYMEKHSTSRLIGAPPGYVGYDESGQLTEAVRRRPYSVVLLDEIEKAHPEVYNLFLQVFDEGRLTDGKGRTIDFRNTIIIATSNLGSEIMQQANGIKSLMQEANAIRESIENENKKSVIKFKNPAKNLPKWEDVKNQIVQIVKKFFKPEFVNRIDEIIIFNSLNDEDIKSIVKFGLSDLKCRLLEQEINIEFSDKAIDMIAKLSFSPEYGARPVKRFIDKEISNLIANNIITGKISKGEKYLLDYSEVDNTFVVKHIT